MKNSSKAPGNRGRPPDPAKREAIIKAAGALFLESEMGDISMDDLAKKAKVSKITVYKHFADKRELFQTMIEKKMAANLSDPLFVRLQGLDAFEDLVTIARGFTNVIYSKDGVNMYRTVVAESKRGADIPHMFYAKAVEPSNKLLEAHLGKLERTGEYAFPDKHLATSIFFSMFKGDRYMRTVMILPEHEEQGETEGVVRQIVRLYLKMFKLPEQKTVIENKRQHFVEQLNKLISGVQKLTHPLMIATDCATSPVLLSILNQTSALVVKTQSELQQLSEQQRGSSSSNASPALVAMYEEVETELTRHYALDSLRDEVIRSHFFRILQFISTCCNQLMDTADAIELDTRAIGTVEQEFATQTIEFGELCF